MYLLLLKFLLNFCSIQHKYGSSRNSAKSIVPILEAYTSIEVCCDKISVFPNIQTINGWIHANVSSCCQCESNQGHKNFELNLKFGHNVSRDNGDYGYGEFHFV